MFRLKYSVIFVGVLLTIISKCNSLNILGIFPYQGKSHFFVFSVYLQELANRGHNVTVISHFPNKESLNNYHDVSLAGSLESMEGQLPFSSLYTYNVFTLNFLLMSSVETCEALLKNDEVHQLLNSDVKFDVAVVEQFSSDCSLGLAYKFNVPVVGITSHVLMPWHYNRIGAPSNPSYVPFHFSGGGTKPSLYDRVTSTVYSSIFNIMYKYVSQGFNQYALSKYFKDVPPLEELAKDIKVMLLYTHPVLLGSRLFPPNVIEIGGFHVKKPKPLSGELLNFMEGAKEGVIYISFGSLINTSSMSQDKINAIRQVISELPQRFVWKLEDTKLVEGLKNVYVSKWLPQNDILAHPKTLAFYSHCGNLGLNEAIYHGVPVVGMPHIGDQPSNAAAVEESGLGVRVLFGELTKDNLLAAFRKVIEPKFREKVKMLSRAWHDRPRSSMDTAVLWTEYAANHRNVSLRNPAVDVPFYQYYLIDVTLVLLIPLAIMFIFSYLLCSKSKKVPSKKDSISSKKNK